MLKSGHHDQFDKILTTTRTCCVQKTWYPDTMCS